MFSYCEKNKWKYFILWVSQVILFYFVAFLQTSEQVPATQTAWDVILVSDLFIVQLPDSSMWLVKTLVCWFCPAESGKLSKVFFLRPCFCFVLGFVTHESESRTENMLQCNWRFSNFLLSLSLSLRTPHSWISVQLWWNQFLRLLKKLVHLNKFKEEKTEKDKRGYRHILPIQLA